MTAKAGSPIPFEHERRFFPDLEIFRFDPKMYKEVHIKQGYLEDVSKTRVRAQTGENGIPTYWQTRKTGHGITRTEDEKQISKHEFDVLWKSVKAHLVKTRYCVQIVDSDHEAEVNVFHGNLAGYVQIEVEFSSNEEALAFSPPDWFGKDVTDDETHGNYYLAKYGCKDLLAVSKK